MLLTLSLVHAQDGVPGYYATPDVHGGVVVFASEGDLWLGPLAGGVATRLTRSDGEETNPQFSPDGKHIAFSARYDGTGSDVYLMPTWGGEPRRLTFHGAEDKVRGWTPDGSAVLYASDRDEPYGWDRMWSVPAAGGASALLSLARATFAAIAPDGRTVAFVPQAWVGRNTKRYVGGMASDIHVGDLAFSAYRRLTTWIGNDDHPMWHEGRLYFLSDRTGITDLWSVTPEGGDLRAHTHLEDYEAREASIGPSPTGSTIVFARGADLWAFDPASNVARPLTMRLASDRAAAHARPVSAAGFLDGFAPSPDGSRVWVNARGNVAGIPVEEGRRIDLVPGSGLRLRGASPSPDGLFVAAWEGGSAERLAVFSADGRSSATLAVPGTEHAPVAWAPDGKGLAWSDETGTLWVLNMKNIHNGLNELNKLNELIKLNELAAANALNELPAANAVDAPVRSLNSVRSLGSSRSSGPLVAVDRDSRLEIDEYTFSPDGRWLAYVRTAATGNGQVWLHDRKARTNTPVTDPDFHTFSPAWNPESDVLYVLSHRVFDPLVSGDDTSPAYASGPAGGMPEFAAYYDQMARPYAVLLRPDGRSPFTPPDPLAPPAKTTVDLTGVLGRSVPVPVETNAWIKLRSTPTSLVLLAKPHFRLSGAEDVLPNFPGEAARFDFATRETLPIGTDILDLEPSADGSAVVLRTPGGLLVVTDAEPAPLELGTWTITLAPADEWRQIFDETWRRYGAFFWSPTMHGVDWDRMRDRWLPLLSRVGTRDELNRLQGELVGELANPHSYVELGDAPYPPGVATAALGADLVPHPSGGAVISRIYPGYPWDPDFASPLAEPGVNLKPGDRILAVDGQAIPAGADPLAALVGRAGLPTVLSVQTAKGKAREVLVTPTESDVGARYLAEVAENRSFVTTATGGKVAYLHIRNMMGHGFADFTRGWFSQVDAQGFVLDLRSNGGGYVSQLMLDRVRRALTGFVTGRNQAPERDHIRAFRGALVVVCDAWTASDGEAFTANFQALGLGKVVGSRTWGGLVGYRGARTVVDGGFRSEPEFGQYGLDGTWSVEGWGVVPDVQSEMDPTLHAAGRDPQLEKAVEVMLSMLATAPPLPQRPPYPDGGLDAFRATNPIPAVP